ncbi:MAG: hypothetical protein ACLFOY_04345 [Desulfatibacillaceae bacterium]
MLTGNGRILKVKAGYNPNSSSIGTNLTPLLILDSMAALAVPIASFYVARWLRKKREGSEAVVPEDAE